MSALTQAEMARELHISRSTMSDNVKAGCPLTSVGEARQWRRRHVREKYNQRAHDAELRARPRQTEDELPDDDQVEEQSNDLHDPCPDLPMVTPSDQARKYICWGLYFRRLPRATAEWVANHLVGEITAGRGDIPEEDGAKTLSRKRSKAA